MSVISYNTEPILQKKRVLFEPETSTDTLKAGYVVCYNNDRTTDLRGTSVAEGAQNPARFLQVEKPKTANLNFVAGIVCPDSEGAVDGDWIDIYLLNGADIPVWSDQACVNGTTTLAVTDGSYLATAVGASNVSLGLAKETINRTTPGLVLLKSYQPASPATSYATLSALVGVLSDAVSELDVSAMDDLSDVVSANSIAIASVAADVATNSNLLSELSSLTSVLSDQCATGDASLATAISTAEDALSDAVSNVIATDTASLATAITTAAGVASDLTSAAKESALSHIVSLEDFCSDLISLNSSAIASVAVDIATISNTLSAVSNQASLVSNLAQSNATDIANGVTSANTARSTFSDAVETARSALSNAVSAVTDALSAELSTVSLNLSNVSNLAQSNATDIANGVTSANTARSTLSNAVSGVTDSVATAIVTLSNAVSGLADTLSAAVSDALESLHSYESALSAATSEAKASAAADWAVNSNLISAVSTAVSGVSNLAEANSDLLSLVSVATLALDNDATSVLSSTAVTSTTSLHILFSKITLADGTTFSCVTNVKSAS